MKCASCGGEIDAQATACVHCGAAAGARSPGGAPGQGARAVFHVDTSPPATEARLDSMATPLPRDPAEPPPVSPADDDAAHHGGWSGDLPDHADAPYLYGGFWRRVAAYLVDFVIVILLAFAVGLVLGFIEAVVIRHASRALGNLVGIVLLWLYFALQESSAAQATLGKRALGLKVTDLQGEPISFLRATGRHFGKYLSALLFGVGFLMAGWTRRKQCLHDMVAGTLVVSGEGLQYLAAGDDRSRRGAPSGMPGWAIALVGVGGMMVLVVGTLAAIAVPAYKNYVVRAQVAEGLVLAGTARDAMTEYYDDTNGQWPESNADAGLASPDALSGKFVSSIDVGAQPGEIVVTYAGDKRGVSDEIRGRQLVLAPEVQSAGVIVWRCDLSATTVPDRDLPTRCRNSAPD